MRTVHLIDDDTPLLVALKRRLKLAGFNVLTYCSAEQFLARGKDGQWPSCIICDVGMPGMSGLELQVQLKEKHSTLPILFLSGCADEGIGRSAIEAGAADFLTKPIETERLVCSINSAIARHEKVLATFGLSKQSVATLLERATAAISEARRLRLENQLLQMRGRQCILRMVGADVSYT